MEVMKRPDALIKTTGSVLRIAEEGIRTRTQAMEKALTAASSQEENEQAAGMHRKHAGVHPRFQGTSYDQLQWSNRMREGAKDKNKQWNGRMKETGQGRPGMVDKSSAAKAGRVKDRQAAEAAGHIAASEGKKAVKGAASVKRAANVTGTAAAGAATAGAAIGAAAAAEAAKKTARRRAAQIRHVVEQAVSRNRQIPGQEGTVGCIDLLGRKQKRASRESGSVLVSSRLFLIGIAAFCALLLLASLPMVILAGQKQEETQPAEGRKIVETARQEVLGLNIGGTKYKLWYGMDDNWCAMFVSWCAEQCGYLDAGIMPKTASVSNLKAWYAGKGLYKTKESGYLPQPGDIVIFGNGKSHTGIVVACDPDAGIVTTIEGNAGKSSTEPYHMGSCVKEKRYPLSYRYIVGYGTPQYPKEETGETDAGAEESMDVL